MHVREADEAVCIGEALPSQSYLNIEAIIDAAKSALRDSPGSIFVRFLKFGALAWGGPAAQIEMIKHECVDDLGWVDEETFKKTLAVYQVLPGPEAHELCVDFGHTCGGKLGGFAAGLGFMLPRLPAHARADGRSTSKPNLSDQPRRALLRADGGGRGDRRPGAPPPERHLHHRCSAGVDRGRRIRLDGLRGRELPARPARRRDRLRPLDQRRGAGAARPGRWRRCRSFSSCSPARSASR